jgi:hypothetical protein
MKNTSKNLESRALLMFSALLSLAFAGYFAAGLRGASDTPKTPTSATFQALTLGVRSASSFTPRAAVSDVVAKALAFKALLTAAQQQTLEQTYTTALGRRWSGRHGNNGQRRLRGVYSDPPGRCVFGPERRRIGL